jgi:hypothetical protein
MGQWPTPVEVSTSRKLAQPFVRQYGCWAAEARRRRRRIELDRPATLVVMVLEVIPWFFPAALAGSARLAATWCSTADWAGAVI